MAFDWNIILKSLTARCLCWVLLLLSQQAVLVAQEIPPTAQIRQILRERIDKNKKSAGIVVGVITAKGSQVIGYGKLGQEKNQEPDGNTQVAKKK